MEGYSNFLHLSNFWTYWDCHIPNHDSHPLRIQGIINPTLPKRIWLKEIKTKDLTDTFITFTSYPQLSSNSAYYKKHLTLLFCVIATRWHSYSLAVLFLSIFAGFNSCTILSRENANIVAQFVMMMEDSGVKGPVGSGVIFQLSSDSQLGKKILWV